MRRAAILTITPNQVLAVGRAHYLVFLSGLHDVYGNSFRLQRLTSTWFTTAYSTATTGPSVIGTNPDQRCDRRAHQHHPYRRLQRAH